VIQHLVERKFGGLRLQLGDSTFGQEEVWRSASGDRHDKKKQQLVDQEPRSAHGQAVRKTTGRLRTTLGPWPRG